MNDNTQLENPSSPSQSEAITNPFVRCAMGVVLGLVLGTCGMTALGLAFSGFGYFIVYFPFIGIVVGAILGGIFGALAVEPSDTDNTQ